MTVPGLTAPVEVLYLTTRERQVLRRVCMGWCSEEIAKGLGIAEATVRGHEHDIRRILGLGDRGALMAWGLQNPDGYWHGYCVERSHDGDCPCSYCRLTAEFPMGRAA